MNETFGALLKRAREAQHLKAFEVADQVGIKPSTLSRYENDQQKEAPPPKVLADLARVLEVSEPYMLRALGYLRTIDAGAPEPPFPGDPVKAEAVRILAAGPRPVDPQAMAALHRISQSLVSGDLTLHAREHPDVLRAFLRQIGARVVVRDGAPVLEGIT